MTTQAKRPAIEHDLDPVQNHDLLVGELFIAIPIRLGLAYYLYKLRPRAEALALGLAVFGAVATVLGVGLNVSAWSFLAAVPALGVCGALLLLLLGDPPREKRIAAIVVYAVLVALPAVILLALRLGGALKTR